MNALSLMKGKASLREVTEVLQTALPKTRVRPRVSRRTQAERTALSDARMFDAAMQLIVEQGTHATTLKAIREGWRQAVSDRRMRCSVNLFCTSIPVGPRSWLTRLEHAAAFRHA